jgi:hypothetical protein
MTATHLQKLLLVNNLHAKLLRLFQLGAGFGASQHKIRFLARAAVHFAVGGFNLYRRFFAGQCWQRSGQHKVLFD